MDPIQLVALPLMLEALLLMLMSARGGITTTRFGTDIDCEVDGAIWRSFGLLVSGILIYLGCQALSASSTASLTMAASAVEGGVLAMVAISEGRFKFLAYDVSCSERSTVARLGLSAFVLLLLFPKLLFGAQPTIGGTTLLGFAGLAFLNATTDELSMPGMHFPEGIEPPYAFRVALVLGGVAFLGVALAVSRSAVAQPQANDPPAVPTATAVAPAPAPEPAPTANRAPKPAWHAMSYLQLASESDPIQAGLRAAQEAQGLARAEPSQLLRSAATQGQVWVFRSKNKRVFGIALGPLSDDGDNATLLSSLKDGGFVPGDTLVAKVDDSQLVRSYAVASAEP